MTLLVGRTQFLFTDFNLWFTGRAALAKSTGRCVTVVTPWIVCVFLSLSLLGSYSQVTFLAVLAAS